MRKFLETVKGVLLLAAMLGILVGGIAFVWFLDKFRWGPGCP